MSFQFEVVGVTRKANDQWQVLLEGKFHKVYSSQIFLNLATREEAADYPLGMKLTLGWVPAIEPVQGLEEHLERQSGCFGPEADA